MFAYCLNNSVNNIDKTGFDAATLFWEWITGAGTIALGEPTIIGEIIVLGGAVVFGGIWIYESHTQPTLKQPTTNKSGTDNQNKNKDSRLKGKSGEIKKEGSNETNIGSNGKADKERHWTDHGNPSKHTIPHDHDISWDPQGNPHFGPPQNYWDGNVPIFP